MIKRLLSFFLFACLVMIGTGSALAEIQALAFDTANKLYEQGKFNEAAASFEKLIHAGPVSEALYFNWGNALFKAGTIGQAIAAYERAESLSPRDPDVRANLQFARNQVQGPTLLPNRISRGLGKLSLNEWTCLAAASGWMWLLILTLVQWRPAFRTTLGSYAIWLGILTAALCVCFGAAFYFDCLEPRAIVVAQEVVAHQAPLDESPNAFNLHDGAELEVLDEKDQWLQVRADVRRTGWVRRDSILTRHS